MNDTITSEEKLLKLIRKKKGTNSAKDQDGDSQGKARKRVFSLNKFFQNFNRLLIGCIVVILGYMVSKFFISIEKDENTTSIQLERVDRGIEDKGGIEFPKRKPLSYYQQTIESRDIFLPPWEKIASAQVTSTSSAILPAANLSQEFKLVGIVLDNDPKAIIEDLKEKQTVFLSVGESIRGAELEEIQEYRVIFNYNNAKVELTQ